MTRLLLLFVACIGLLPISVQAQKNTDFTPGQV